MSHVWVQETISSPEGTLGGELQRARIHHGLSLSDVAKDTRIRKDYLKAIEEHNFSEIPYAKIYQRNFVKRYASAVELDPHIFSDMYDELTDTELEQENTISKKPIRSYHLRFPNIPRIIRTILILTIVLIVIGYLVSQVNAMVSPPELVVSSPQNGAITTIQAMEVAGNTEKEVRVQINGEEITTSESGQLIEEIILSPGMNTIEISACTKHGRCTTEVRHVTFSPKI